MASSLTQDADVPTWTVLSPAQGPAAPDSGYVDLDIGLIRGEIDELDHEELAAVEDLIQAPQLSCSPEAFPTSNTPTTSCLSSKSSSPCSLARDTINPTHPSAITKQPHTLPDIAAPNIPATPLFDSSVGHQASTPLPHSPTSTTSPSPQSPVPTFPLPVIAVAGPSSIPAQPQPCTKGTVPKSHRSRVIRSLTGNLTTAGQIARSWAEAINKYLHFVQSTTLVDAKEAKKVYLGAKWALGEMYEAHNDVQRSVLKVCTL